ncbi:MAG: ATP-dependent zinc metalloprotease FtsH [Candidatus Pacebacteria bacterium]|nr:ATP-dependent zinc metalloprotease FtsH [Candidatus Paceibacterota bacterium]
MINTKKQPKKLFKNIIFVLLVFLFISAIFTLIAQPFEEKPIISLTQLAENIQQGQIKEIIVIGDKLIITNVDNQEVESRKETGIGIMDSLINLGVSPEELRGISIKAKEQRGVGVWLGPLLILLLPLLLFGLFFFMIFRQAKSGAMQAFNFTKIKARLFGADGNVKEKVSFKDVAGLKEAKEELQEVVDFLKNPKKYLEMGAKIPRGVLLMGAPGTGKTLLARAVANEAKVPFFSVSGSEFVEMFVGVGSARVKDLFSMAKKAGKSIVFIDELDAIGRIRGSGIGGGHDEREQTLNQILVEMDGFERDSATLVFAATNRPDVLDPALLRPGRFDRRIILDLPDIEGRQAILEIHCRRKPLALDINLKEIAERTPGFSGADLANIVNEAALLAARRNKNKIFQEEMFESIERVLLGPERKSHILSQKEKEIAAYHETGHAITASLLPGVDPVRKISIIARGNAAGYTLKLPSREVKLKTHSSFLNELVVLLGGYSAEKLIFGEVTTGASNDLEQASNLARKLIKQFGMSKKLGPVVYGEKEELVFLGREISEQRNYSEEIASKIDKEITQLISQAEKTSYNLLKKNRKLLNKITKVLIEKETIERQEFEKLLKGTKDIPFNRKTKSSLKPLKKESLKIKNFKVRSIK